MEIDVRIIHMYPPHNTHTLHNDLIIRRKKVHSLTQHHQEKLFDAVNDAIALFSYQHNSILSDELISVIAT